MQAMYLPSEQPAVDGSECEDFEQQPYSQREEDQSERLNKQVEANMKQRTGQLLQREEVNHSQSCHHHYVRSISRHHFLTSVFSDRPLLKKMSETAM